VLDGRTVLVTGASTGIGRATALLLARLGANVLAGMRTPQELGAGITPIRLDVTDPGELGEIERLDGLVNNAGIAITGPLEFLPLDELRRQLEVNVIAQLAVTQACMPALRNAHGRIVNISSISGRVALPLYGPYAASKFALEALSDSLRREQADVPVVLIEPGSIATPIWDRSLAAADALYAAMPPLAHERYDTLVAKLRALAQRQGEEGDPPEAVARIVATALATSKPRTRYVVGRNAQLQAAIARLLPGRAMDKLLAKRIVEQSE
jgi:NAD(P)-dependent dehydrogenase (short-subunit alcohol dehydrogenase family)